MSTIEIATRSREQAAANDRAVLTTLAQAGDEGLSPGELQMLVQLSDRTVRQSVTRLIERGLARREGKRRIWATTAGRSESISPQDAASAFAPALDDAIALLPSEALRAFARLQLSAVVARRHLSSTYHDGWPGFVALGPTGTGKTLTAKLVCRVFELKEAQAIRLLIAGHETFGSLFGRRERDGKQWRVTPGPLLSLPFVTLDEFDKAPLELRSAAGGFLLGSNEAIHEDVMVEIRSIACLTLNRSKTRDLDTVLPDAFIRRAVMIDTEPLLPLLDDLDESAHRLLGGDVIPRIDLDRLRPPETLPDELRHRVRELLKTCLTPDGWRLTQVDALAKIVLGRAALIDGDLDRAADETAIDYLACAATLEHAIPGTARVLSVLSTGGPLSPDIAALESEFGHTERLRAERESAKMADRLQFEADREEIAAQLREMRRRLPRPQTPREAVEAAVLRRVFESCEATIRGARSRQSLDAAQQAIAGFFSRGQAMIAAKENEQRRPTQEAESDRQRQVEERRQQIIEDHRHELKRGLAKRIKRVDAEIRRLEKLRWRKTGDPLPVLSGTKIEWTDGRDYPLLYFEPGAQRPPNVVGAIADALLWRSADQVLAEVPTGAWRSPWDEMISLDGTERHCDQLRHWTLPAVRTVIDAPLRALSGHRAKLDEAIARLSA